MKIIFIVGICNPKAFLRGWKKDLHTQFPKSKIILLSDFYYHWQIEKMENMVQKGVQILEDGEPALIFAHSFGGILAKTIISRVKRHNVQKLIMMASPNQMNFFGCGRAKKMLRTPYKTPVKTDTYGAFLDPIVPFFLTPITRQNHTNIWGEHLCFIFSKAIRKRIIKKSLEEDM